MSLRDTLIAIAIAAVWGISFIAIKIGVSEMPALMFSALRFLLASVPAVFFLRPPRTSVKLVVGYGLDYANSFRELPFIGVVKS